VRNLTSEVREQQIEWRRSQILELTSQGYNQREICQKLKLDKSAVKRYTVLKTTGPRQPSETYP
jgi:DNA-binding NarL/FixJ family response regulator